MLSGRSAVRSQGNIFSSSLRKEKSGPLRDRFERGKEGGEVSGKAMQGEVEANAKTLGLEKTTILEEG